MMNYIAVNCEKLPFSKTLGVSHFVIELCAALSQYYKIVFVTNAADELTLSPVGERIRDFAEDIVELDGGFTSFSLQSYIPRNRRGIELLPHHFQPPRFGDRSILICHDLHCFDIPWKYSNAAQVQAEFRSILKSTDAIFTHFPRTYYTLERTIGLAPKNLFLTESPLLMNPEHLTPEQRLKLQEVSPPILLYPAQIQEHKNHSALVLAAKQLKDKGQAIRILCTGTTFHDSLTGKLEQQIFDAGVGEYVELIGRVTDEELLRLYSISSGVIIPSLAEGGAYVALEAIAAGLPVAVNRIDSATQHLRAFNGQVIWFDALSNSSTVHAISCLLSTDTKSWYATNNQARERISQLSWTGVAKKWHTVIHWLLGESTKPRVLVDSDGWNIDIRNS